MSAVKQLVTKSFPQQVRTNRLLLEKSNTIKIELGNTKDVHLANISETGMAIVTTDHIEKTNSFPVIITFQNEKSIKLVGQIAWSRQDGRQNYYGVNFINGVLPEGLLIAYEKMNELLKEIGDRRTRNNGIDPKFKELTYEIRDFLTDVKTKLESLEETILIESKATKESYRFIVSTEFELEFVRTLRSYNLELDKIFSKIRDKDEKAKYNSFFREELGRLYTQGAYVGRAFHKPRGYAGDYEMMNQIYRNEDEGKTLFEMLMHKYGVNEAAAMAVRYRRDYLLRMIKTLASNKNKFVFGSLACGPAREVVDFLSELNPEDSNRFTIVLMDQDIHSLLNAKRNISEVIFKRGLSCEIHYVPLSVKNILEQSEKAAILKEINFDFLYTAGLYDYLTQPVAKFLTNLLYPSISPEGMMVIGNFNPDNPTKTISELAADWRLIHRTDEEMYDLVKGLDFTSSNLHKDEQRIISFLEIKK